MKKKMLWAILAAAGTALTIYFVRKRRGRMAEDTLDGQPRKRFNKAFSRAKEYANGEVG